MFKNNRSIAINHPISSKEQVLSRLMNSFVGEDSIISEDETYL